MNSSMHIREAGPDDLLDLCRLLAQLGYPDLKAEDVAGHLQTYRQPDYHLVVMETEGHVCGFAALHWYQTFHLNGLTGRIVSFCVDEAIRSKGHGAHLLAFCEQFLFSRGCVKIELTSNLRRARAHAFYLRNGYVEVSRHFIKKRDP